MLLNEIKTGRYVPDQVFAWLESSRGPEDIMGVRLAFISPIEDEINHYLQQAIDDRDDRRIKTLQQRLEAQRKYYPKQKYYTPDIGWWSSKEGFYNGEPGAFGGTREEIMNVYPHIQIFPSRQEAEKAAEKAGLI